jgi:transcriptional regulator with XRE-family HTH domain
VTTTNERLATKIAAAAARNPSVDRAMREERAALQVAAGVAEILEARDKTEEYLAEKSGVPLEEVQRIVEGTTEGATSVATLTSLAAALDYRFGIAFVPKELPLSEAEEYVRRTEQLSIRSGVSSSLKP